MPAYYLPVLSPPGDGVPWGPVVFGQDFNTLIRRDVTMCTVVYH